jgi:guanylate kinase
MVLGGLARPRGAPSWLARLDGVGGGCRVRIDGAKPQPPASFNGQPTPRKRDAGMILTLTGASGAGKSTLAKALIRLLHSAELSPGCTTRAMRFGETPADVHHLSQDEFSEMRERGEFQWAVEVHGVWYGTLRRVVAEGLGARAHHLLFALTSDVLPILRDFAEQSGRREEVFSIYVLSPGPEVLRERLATRGSDIETIERRLRDCENWDAAARSSDLYDLLVPGEGDVEQNARHVINSLGMPTRA